MDKEIKNFLEEMDELTKKGIFGDQAKTYSYLKDNVDIDNFLLKIFTAWLQNKNQIGKENVLKIIKLFLNLYYNCFKVNPDKTIEILNYFIDGVPDVEKSDIVTPFYSWFQSMQNYRDSLPIGRYPGSPYQVAQNMITTYQKGIELINRIIVILLFLKYEIIKEKYSPKEIFELSLYWKVKKYEEIFLKEYIEIINLIDRNLRNAESHLDLRYSRKQNKIIYIVRQKKSTKIIRLPIDKFIIGIFPNPGFIIQGYIFSLMLIVIIAGKHNINIEKIFS